MRILHSMAGASVGGAETFFVDAVKAIDEIGFAQRVVTRANNLHKVQEIAALDIYVDQASFHNVLSWPTSRTLKRAVGQFRPDIVHNWMGRAGSFSPAGAHRNIGWYGGYYKPDRFSRCDHHVAVTQDIADHIVKHGVPADRVSVLHVYAEFDKAEPLDRAEFDTPEGVPLLLSLSRLHPKKGLDTLLAAMTDVQDAHLWIAGSGSLEGELKAQTRSLDLEDRVRFLGWRNDRGALLATADLCVFPSRYEPFGAVVIEAWGTNTPLIAAKAAGPLAYVTHEEDGLLVEIDDSADLARSINRAIGDKYLRSHLVLNGRTQYEKKFTKDVFKANVAALYNSLMR